MSNPAQTGESYFHLISCTEDPIETLMAVWITSRPTQYETFLKWNFEATGRRIPTAEDVKDALSSYGHYTSQLRLCTDEHPHTRLGSREQHQANRDAIGLTTESVEEVFKKVVAMSIPVSECISITWGFTGLPISWREQAVRKRNFGFWLTSMREFPMDDFVSTGRFRVAERWQGDVDEYLPKALEGLENAEDHGAGAVLADTFAHLEKAYNKLIELGMTQEEARGIIPLDAKHNGTMFGTLRTLLETVKSRSCWIAQVDLWAPVLQGMVRDLKKIHPLLGGIVSPPCFDRYSNEYKGCSYKLINENRCGDKDPFLPCPIYTAREVAPHVSADVAIKDIWEEIVASDPMREPYLAAAKRHLPIWGQVWGRDPYTGQLKDE